MVLVDTNLKPSGKQIREVGNFTASLEIVLTVKYCRVLLSQNTACKPEAYRMPLNIIRFQSGLVEFELKTSKWSQYAVFNLKVHEPPVTCAQLYLPTSL